MTTDSKSLVVGVSSGFWASVTNEAHWLLLSQFKSLKSK